MQLYTYKASLIRVLDGDTVEVRVDLGFDISFKTLIRINGIDTPETKGKSKAAGLAVSEWVRRALSRYPFTVVSKEWDKYGGRVVGDVYLTKPGTTPVSLATLLLDEKMAKPYSGDNAKTAWTALELERACASSHHLI